MADTLPGRASRSKWAKAVMISVRLRTAFLATTFSSYSALKSCQVFFALLR
jgi:hypothetical protein